DYLVKLDYPLFYAFTGSGFSAAACRRGWTEFQDVLDHTGRTFTLLGDSDRARCHSRFHQLLACLRARSTKER
ncbi:MAG: hypothetical protein V3W19_07290, partial [Desulfatiglandales bacterium]